MIDGGVWRGLAGLKDQVGGTSDGVSEGFSSEGELDIATDGFGGEDAAGGGEFDVVVEEEGFCAVGFDLELADLHVVKRDVDLKDAL